MVVDSEWYSIVYILYSSGSVGVSVGVILNICRSQWLASAQASPAPLTGSAESEDQLMLGRQGAGRD